MMETKDVVDFDHQWYKTATEDERKMFRDWLLGVLRMHESVDVTFIKKDGSERVMRCTLKESIVPKVENPKESNTVCTVWDCVLNQWRSFYFENIKNINFTL